MLSALQTQLLIALFLITLLKVKTASIEDEGLACSNMASALPKLQTLTGAPHIAVKTYLQTKTVHSD